jgi:hypothetical protein
LNPRIVERLMRVADSVEWPAAKGCGRAPEQAKAYSTGAAAQDLNPRIVERVMGVADSVEWLAARVWPGTGTR